MQRSPPSPLTALADLGARLAAAGCALIDAAALRVLTGVDAASFEGWRALRHDLPPDPHLRDTLVLTFRHGGFQGPDGAA
jgi:hypothetical protein